MFHQEAPHAKGLADTCIDEEYEEPKKARDKEVYPNIIGTIPGKLLHRLINPFAPGDFCIFWRLFF